MKKFARLFLLVLTLRVLTLEACPSLSVLTEECCKEKPYLLFGGSASADLAKEIAAELQIPLGKATIGKGGKTVC